MAESSISVLASRATELANDAIVILMDFHSSVVSRIGEDYVLFGLIGLTLAAIGSFTSMTKHEEYVKNIFAIVVTGISLWPISVTLDDFNTSADTSMSELYTSNSYKVALAPYYIQKIFDTAYLKLSYLTTSALPDGDGQNNSAALDSLQAISISNSSVGYLMERTPLYSSLLAYNSICTPAASVINSTLSKPLTMGEQFALGLYGGANFVGRKAFHDVHGGSIYDIWPARGDFPIVPPTNAHIEALSSFPKYDQDLVPNGIMILSRDYWTKVTMAWLSSIDANPNMTFEGLRQNDVLKAYKMTGLETESNVSIDTTVGGMGYGVSENDIKIHREKKYTPTSEMQNQSAGTYNGSVAQYNRYWPSNCQEFYEIVYDSYKEFYIGLKDYTALPTTKDTDRIQNLKRTSVDNIAINSLQSLVDLPPVRVDPNDPYRAISGGVTSGVLDISDDIAVQFFSRLESFFKSLNLVISGPILISTITLGLGLLFAVSPIWFLVQVMIPGSALALKSYTKVVTMLYVWILCLFIGTTLSDAIAGMVLQAHQFNQTEYDIVVSFDAYSRNSESLSHIKVDPLINENNSINSLDVQIVGLHFLGLLILTLASSAAYMIVQGADKGLKQIGTNVTHAEKGMAAVGALGAKLGMGAIKGVLGKAFGSISGAAPKATPSPTPTPSPSNPNDVPRLGNGGSSGGGSGGGSKPGGSPGPKLIPQMSSTSTRSKSSKSDSGLMEAHESIPNTAKELNSRPGSSGRTKAGLA